MSIFDKIPATMQAGVSYALVIGASAGALFVVDLFWSHTTAEWARNSEIIAQMVKSGASPIEASCAIGRIDRNAPVCVMSLMSATPAGGPLPETLAPGEAQPGNPT